LPKQNNEKNRSSKSIINKILNVTNDEWPRIAISWFLQLFYRIGYIIGWTIFISLFITNFGLKFLPFFFIIYGVFRILGALLFSNYIHHFKKDKIILFTALSGAVLLFTVSFLRIVSEPVFILVTLPVIAVFFSQLYILISAFIEELFSPLESERTFPIIESAETIGGIIGGLLIAVFVSYIPTANFIYLMIISLLFVAPIILFHRQILKKLPFINFKRRKKLPKLNMEVIKQQFLRIKKMPFLKVLLIVVLVQWIFMNLLEFQYTKAVFQNISHDASHMQKELTFELGSLHILFHSFALIMQLLVAGRIISSLGVIGSLILHPIVTLLSLGGMFFRFGFLTAVITKNNFEMTSVIHKSAYHTSYYAFEPEVREQAREVLEGFAQPLGMISGMLMLLVLQELLQGAALTAGITALMIGIMVVMLYILLKNESKYTRISIKNLFHSNDPLLQLNAVEVLGERGHKNATEILTKMLRKKTIDKKLKIKILKTLGHMQDPLAILEILDCLQDKNRDVRIAALKALDSFKKLQKDSINRPFSIHRINEVLKKVFSQEDDNSIKAMAVRILTKINKKDIVPFLLDVMENSNNQLKADCISVCSSFHDINIAHYLIPYLSSDDPKIRAQTIIALWKFKKFRIQLMEAFKEMLYSENKDEKMEAYRVIGNINAIQEKHRLIESLNSNDNYERFVAAVSLAKMGFKEGVPYIAEAMLKDNTLERSYNLSIHENMPKKIKKHVLNSARQQVCKFVNDLLNNTEAQNIEELDKNTLLQLRKAYELVNEHEEVQNIDDILKSKLDPSIYYTFNPT
jgi:HEAT repeat protein/MFS family permease